MWKLLLASCTLLSVLQPIVGVQYCPNSEFQLWKGYCYSFTTNSAQKWDAARTTCQSKSTAKIKVDIVSITSDEENKFIFDTMKPKTYNDYWIGLRRNQGGDGFYWVDAEKSTYRNWAPGEPNDGNGNGKEECTEVSHYSTNGQWNDMPCTGYTTQAFVCKGKAYSGWEKKGDWEYFIDAGSGDESRNWYGARDWCNENGGELASITSPEERDNIYELIKLMGFKAFLWTGLNKLQGDQTKWAWSDGTTYGNYDNWKAGYPTEDTVYRHHCGTVYTDDTTGEWRNTHCDSLDHGFVCKRDPNNIGVKTTPAPVTGGGVCPYGYIEAGDKCFRLHVRTRENGHTWSEAVQYCRTGSHYRHDIATISNPFEQAVINSALQESSLPLWVGLYRRGAGNAEWLWSDNAQYEYSNWGFGKPTTNTGLCAGVRPFAIPIGSWADKDCDKKQGFICQTFKNPANWISSVPTTANSCKSGYKPYWKGCYKHSTDAVTWDTAKTRCSNDGADLVWIMHGAENGYIQSLANEGVKMPLWIGLRDTGRTGEYKWSNNWAVLYTLWGDDEPSQDPDNGGCVRLRPGDGTWEDTACTALNGFVCKTTDEPAVTVPPPSQGRCPSVRGWTEHGSYCYKFHQLSYDTWADAAIKCKADSILANLVSIHSLEENNWLYEQLTATGFLSNHVWIGMFRRTDTNGFAWNDLSAVQFEHWAPLEPNGEALGQNCVGFHKNYHKMWLDQPCSTRQGYVCKAPKVVYPTLAPEGPGYCPPNWVNISNHCYHFEPNVHLEWIDARMFCKNLEPSGNADLVTIKDIAEDIFVNTEMVIREDTIGENNEFWIGLAKKMKGADYNWVDESSTEDYKNWDKGEPSGKDDGTTNCAFQYVNNAKWDDADCNEYKGFACKMVKLPDPAAPTNVPTVRLPADDNSGPSGGDVAGIVVGTLIGVALLGVLIFFLHKNNINPVTKAKDMVSGFSNPFYSSGEDTKPVTNSTDDTLA